MFAGLVWPQILADFNVGKQIPCHCLGGAGNLRAADESNYGEISEVAARAKEGIRGVYRSG